jgi:hypothetical protein
MKMPSAAPTAAISSAPIRAAAMADDEDEVDPGPLNIMAVLALVASLAAAFLAFASVDGWPLSEGPATTEAQRTAWKNNESERPFHLPLDYSPFDKKVGEEVKSTYKDVEPAIPVRPEID